MRLGVLDVGSNTVHLLVMDAHRGGHPLPARSEKTVLRLAEHVDETGKLSRRGADALVAAVAGARRSATALDCDDLLAFATSAVREARNGSKVLERVRDETGVDLQVLTGPDEARLTFLAVRRWFGWSAGRLLVLDIGGGSLEIAAGIDEEPELALSLPLGAGRLIVLDIGGGSLEIACGRDEEPELAESVPLGAGRITRERLSGDPPDRDMVAALRPELDKILAPMAARVLDLGRPDRVAATSKTFRSLARLAGAAPSSEGMLVRRTLTTTGLRQVIGFISRIPSADLAELEGVSAARAHQLLAGALVAESTMRALQLDLIEICPWALREGVILRRLDWLGSA